MSIDVQTQRTGRFIDLWPHIALVVTVLVLLALLISGSFAKTLVSTQVQVSEGEPARLQPLVLQRATLGALRIEVKAVLPSNQWVTYEIQLQDSQGKVLASGLKQAWSESGTWQEEGESGSWQEDDLWGGLDVRSAQSETVSIVVDVLEYGDTAGQELDQPVPFEITVRNGVVDGRYLWAGLLGSGSLAALAYLSVLGSGKGVIAKTMPFSDIGERAVVGGPNNLVKVVVAIAADDTAPQRLQVALVVSNRNGDPVHQQTDWVRLRFHRNDKGTVEKATAQFETLLMLEPRSSYRFAVEVTPDASVDSTCLRVSEGARTLRNVEVSQVRWT
ncbi:hypothetical protein [Leptolyngbya sp. FACHB-261]|uniref:hypothetical protein n=1 Tax=Leptolyngbya sp. FACHB-261 TaxID=2692806 RepID=UPI001683C029|nr:hypothetical protein [Leptolyngbya sp. FACHB-261]MBD2103633.1 hypothetical protein [Leptolyngbya sp. FACHB-261]